MIGRSDVSEQLDTDARGLELKKGDNRFPPQLTRLDEFDHLYVRGDVTSLEQCVAIIGSRKASPYGLSVASMIAGWCAQEGITVVSGCARGCDQAAHRGALEAGGKTVAVLGCGADISYPANAQRLLAKIALQGAVISEYPWGTRAARFRFVRRNRLIAALSMLVIIIEGALPSGTFSTVNHATELGVAIGAVPGPIFSALSAAPNYLIQEGAYCITSKEDLLSACSLEGFKGNFASRELLEEESDLVRALRSTPLTPEEISQYCKIELSEALTRLQKLESQGYITRFAGGRYALLSHEKVSE